MGIHQVIVIAVNASNCFFSFYFVNPSCEEFTLNNFQMFFFNFVATFTIEFIHQSINFFCVFVGNGVQQAFQVTGNKNIHGRRNSFEEFTASVINTGVDEISKNIVAVRCAQQTFHRQAHQLSIVAGKDVTKVTGRNNKVNVVTHFNAACFNCIYISTKVVHDLRNKASPVNGVSRGESVAFFFQFSSQFIVTEDFFYAALCIVKIAFNTKNFNVLAHLGNHLAFLDIAYTLARIENDNFSAFNISETFERSFTGITGSSNKNYNFMFFASLSNCFGKNMGQKLQRHIFESRSRTVPQFQNRSVSVHFNKRSRFATKFFGSVSISYTFTQFVFGEVSQEMQQDIYCAFGVRFLFHSFNIAQTNLRETFRNEQTAIACQATSNSVGSAY